MTVHKKALLIIVVTLVAMISAVSLISASILMKSAARSEKSQIDGELQRVQDAVLREISMLDSMTQDYATWDDSYTFIRDRNETYIKANCNDNTLATNRFNFMVYTDPSGRIVFSRCMDLKSGKETPLVEGLGAHLVPGGLLNKDTRPTDYTAGVLVLPKCRVLLSSRPILTSDAKGPIRGTLTIGRLLDQEELSELSKITSLRVDYRSLDPREQTPENTAALRALSASNQKTSRIVDRNTVRGYCVLLDVLGKPVGALTISLHREYHALLLQNLRISVISLVAVACAISLLMALLMDRLILRRLVRINTFFQQVKSTDSLSQRVKIRGRDEISQLGESINEMMETLEQDVAERRRAEEAMRLVRELEMAKEAAEGASQAKNLFLANMTHELRTPLNGIIGITEVVMDTGLNEEQMDLLNTIRAESEHLAGIVNEVLDFAKIEAGRVELEEIAFDLRYLLDSIARLFVLQAKQKGLEFVSSIAPDVPVMLLGDPARLRQILVNLIGNALKFTHRGSIFMRADLLEAEPERATIRFSVTDTGIGIARESQESIFKSFTQAEKSTTRNYGGTGLGLTISKHIVELMGGQMGVESEQGVGSTFWLEVPLPRQKEKKATAEGKGDLLRNLGVLVISDEQTPPAEVMTYLDDYGARPMFASGSDAALSAAVEMTTSGGEAGLVIVHIGAEEPDAFRLVREVKGFACFHDLPLVMVRETGEQGDVGLCQKLGVAGYLTKPFHRDDLIGVVSGIVSAPASRPAEILTKHSVREAIEPPIRVLLVEDYPTNQRVALRHLNAAGFVTNLAENGREAVESWQKRSYDLILMDVQMPVMDGIEATRTIRDLESKEQRKRVPIVALTAHSVADILNQCRDAGADDYLIKPLRQQTLLQMVEKWTQRAPTPEIAPVAKAVEAVSATRASRPLDFNRAVKEFGGDRAFLLDTCGEFIDHVGEQIDLLEAAVRDGNPEVVRGEAHSIKGGAANLTADELARRASMLEMAGKAGDLTEAPALLEAFREEFDRFVDFIRGLK